MPDTPYTVQVAIDCAQPHQLADWWAQVLHWQVEPQDAAFIRSMIDQGFASEADTITHNGELVWATGAAITHPDGTGVAPRILFQQVPEPKTVKNRVHLDLRGAEPPSAAELGRILALGATQIGAASQGPHHWVVLTDPEDNELCLAVPAPAGADASDGAAAG